MRLIDADALEKKMYHDSFETDSDMQKWESGCWIRYKLFENNLDNAPTIDIAEVCGECKPYDPCIYCKHEFETCGAKMDKGGDTE